MEKRSIVLSGDRPTGPLHLGHYVGSLKRRLLLQEKYRSFIIIADMQALTDHMLDPSKIKSYLLEVALDYLAVGIDPSKTTIFIQSLVPALPEITLYYLNLVTWGRLKNNPTVKQEIIQKGYGEEVPVGFAIYPVSQVADITAFKASLIPVGEDQLPMLELTNWMVRRFNAVTGTQFLVEVNPLVPEEGIEARLPGTDGKRKMGKSLNNAIYLSDTPDLISKKVRGMYTDPNHLRVEDRGEVIGNPVFDYLKIFDNDKEKVRSMEEHYKRGGLGDVVVKRRLEELLQEFIKPIREKRLLFAADKGEVMKLLYRGSESAAAVAHQTLTEIRSAISLCYEVSPDFSISK